MALLLRVTHLSGGDSCARAHPKAEDTRAVINESRDPRFPGCPAPLMSEQRYTRDVTSVTPDTRVLRLSGCPPPNAQRMIHAIHACCDCRPPPSLPAAICKPRDTRSRMPAIYDCLVISPSLICDLRSTRTTIHAGYDCPALPFPNIRALIHASYGSREPWYPKATISWSSPH